MRELTPRELQIILANETGILANHYRSLLSNIEKELQCIKKLLECKDTTQSMKNVDDLLVTIHSLRPTTKVEELVHAAIK